jgi:hypothetical protein
VNNGISVFFGGARNGISVFFRGHLCGISVFFGGARNGISVFFRGHLYGISVFLKTKISERDVPDANRMRTRCECKSLVRIPSTPEYGVKSPTFYHFVNN